MKDGVLTDVVDTSVLPEGDVSALKEKLLSLQAKLDAKSEGGISTEEHDKVVKACQELESENQDLVEKYNELVLEYEKISKQLDGMGVADTKKKK